MIDYSKKMNDYATFLPAVSKMYADKAISSFARKLPVSNVDLDFLNPKTTLFHYPQALYSAGQANLSGKGSTIFSKRDRAKTMILGDSGGFQIIEGKLKINGKTGPQMGDPERKKIVDWLDTLCDWAMTIDVPSGALGFDASGYSNFRETIHDTVMHLIYIANNRKGTAKYLNCLHGRNKAECDLWFNSVRQFEFEGWAFGSGYNLDYYLILHRILTMRDQKYLEKSERLHFLGQGTMVTGCLLTAVQRAVREINPQICVTFDAASSFVSIANGSAFIGHSTTPKSFSLQTAKVPDDGAYVGSTRPFPWQSPIGMRLSMGDICYHKPRKTSKTSSRTTTWDGLSYLMLMNHNLSVQLEGILAANRVFDLELADARDFCPSNLLELKEIIPEAFKREDWATYLKENERPLRFYKRSRLRKQYDKLNKNAPADDMSKLYEVLEFEERLNVLGDG
jgi:hypothetical protein